MTMYRDTQASQMQEQPVVYGKKKKLVSNNAIMCIHRSIGHSQILYRISDYWNYSVIKLWRMLYLDAN